MEHLFKLLNEEEKRKQQTKEVALFNTPKSTTTKPVAVTTPTKDILPSEAALAVKPVEKSGFFERINWKQVAIWGTIVAAVVTIIAVPCALLIGGDGIKKITSNDFWTQAVTPLPPKSDGTPRTGAVSNAENQEYIKSNLSENILYLGFYGSPDSTERTAWIEHINRLDAYLTSYDESWEAAVTVGWWRARPGGRNNTNQPKPPLPTSYGVSKTYWSGETGTTFAIAKGTIPIDLTDLTSLMIRPVTNETIDTLNSILDSMSFIFLDFYSVLNADGGEQGLRIFQLGTTFSKVNVSNLTDKEK